MCVYILSQAHIRWPVCDFIGGSQCVNVSVSVFETHLVGDRQQHPVQFLHQLFEGRPLGGNSMPALTHHHVATEKRKKQHAQK